MFQIMQPYASLCGIYATQHGGLSYQTGPDDLGTWVQDLCGEDVPIKKIDSGMISDDSAFVSVGNILACKSHAYCNADFVKIPDFSLDSKFFKPYANFSQSLMIRDQKLNSLPNDLLTIFNNLTVLSIDNVDLKDISEFPSGVSKCTNLEVLCLSSLKGIKRLPKDIISGPALSTFFLYNCPVNKLEIDWPVNKGLTSLTLKGLLIQDIPAGLGNLKELLELNLDYNPITTLPKEIESLTKLKHLSVKGNCRK
jgi:Leucine-rich repeat (LRR) protein